MGEYQSLRAAAEARASLVNAPAPAAAAPPARETWGGFSGQAAGDDSLPPGVSVGAPSPTQSAVPVPVPAASPAGVPPPAAPTSPTSPSSASAGGDLSAREIAKRAKSDWQLNGDRASQAAARAPNADGSVRWVPDREVSHCTTCGKVFDWALRRHHCRKCGGVFCRKCSARKAMLPVEFDKRHPTRVCDPCFEELAPLQEELARTFSNSVRDNTIDPNSARRYGNLPLSFTLGEEIRKAAYTITNFTSGVTGMIKDQSIPLPYLQNAKGLAFLTVVKAGFLFTGRIGTGLVVARLPDGSWSAPSAIATLGMGWGAQIGAEVTDFVMILNDARAVSAFAGKGQLSLGAELGVAVGPLGRSAAADVHAGDGGVAPVFTYSHSKGFFAGISLEGAVISARPDVNRKFYGRSVDRKGLLRGDEAAPNAARPLYEALERALQGPGGVPAGVPAGIPAAPAPGGPVVA